MKGLKSTLKERIALLRIKQGDTEAFGYIYEAYVEKIYRYVFFRTSDKTVAEDIAQDVFLTAWQYIAESKPVRNLQALLYRIAYHKVVDHYRLKERQATLLDDASDEAGAIEVDTTEIEMHFLKRNIKALKSEYQDVLILKHIEGLSIKEIAGILSKSENNVRVALHRALQSLKELYLKKYSSVKSRRS